ncbi:DNA/RNA helicase domain-containing protein [Parasphingorhabdus sp.]|uniref:DNA/RNA helicase domain-containing protein n=1 Tax=Parasphingorhabdus sp. TaxID=2709688 RepID=UPI00300388EC
MHRTFVSLAASDLSNASNAELYGQLSGKLSFPVEPTQRSAWNYQINHLRELANDLPDAHFSMEFLIPRMGRRADLIILLSGFVFVVEYKVGSNRFDRSSLNQTYGYGLDLKHFHEPSHERPIVPILVATEAAGGASRELVWDDDDLAQPLSVSADELAPTIICICQTSNGGDPIDPVAWLAGRYKPTPTIVEAAQALYSGHDVEEISRSEAGAENLTVTADYVFAAIEDAKAKQKKIICFITGVPGSGKTLAGLNLATARQRSHSDEHAVFLSGNGPLVAVLREALAIDAVAQAKASETSSSKTVEKRRASAFIQNIHHFRDEALASDLPPDEKVAVFDEAQRAWDVEQTSKFMQQKKGQVGFSMSEPEFLLSVMDRHPDWCAIVCLVGGGQEINTGEAGIDEWLRALERSFAHWEVHIPEALKTNIQLPVQVHAPALHLATSIRSFRAEKLSDFIGHVIDGDAAAARHIHDELPDYPLLITRDLDAARGWLRSRRRGYERAGLLASSNAARLKPHGVFVKAKIEPEKWFLADVGDVRSSDALETNDTHSCSQGIKTVPLLCHSYPTRRPIDQMAHAGWRNRAAGSRYHCEAIRQYRFRWV